VPHANPDLRPQLNFLEAWPLVRLTSTPRFTPAFDISPHYIVFRIFYVGLARSEQDGEYAAVALVRSEAGSRERWRGAATMWEMRNGRQMRPVEGGYKLSRAIEVVAPSSFQRRCCLRILCGSMLSSTLPPTLHP
jgi:hypothetical protein